MDIREATAADAAAIHDVAKRSLETSYSAFLSPGTIESAISEWYAEDAIESLCTDPTVQVLVAVEDGSVIGFSQAILLDENDPVIGEIQWLHVDPDARAHGIGTRLLEGTRERLLADGVEAVTSLVLADNDAGARFYESHGFERFDERGVELEGETHVELVYVHGDHVGPLPETAELVVGPGGTRLWVSPHGSERGSDGPFYPVYRDEEHRHLWGWFCSVCESFDVSMNTMGKMQCETCDNARKPTRWDAAYL